MAKKTAKKSARKTAKKSSKKSSKKTVKKSSKRWSADVTAHSDAMDLQGGVFTLKDPKKIARSLKKSAETSHRRKSPPFRSAMSMLNFYLNRGGKNLPASQKKILDRAKEELRKLFHKEEPS